MTDKKKIVELDNAIAGKEAELQHILSEKREAANDPERLVLAEKNERRVSDQLRGLKAAREAAAYVPPEPSDVEELLQGLQKYRDAHAARVEQARAAVASSEAEQREIETGLHRAAVECDAALTVDLTDRRRENTAKLEALREMEGRAAALPVFPEGALAGEWAAICEKVMPDWKAAALRVDILAAEYRAACKEFLQLHDTLKAVRDELSRLAKEQDGQPLNFAPVFTPSLDTSRMIVDRKELQRVGWVGNDFLGTAL